MDWMCCLCFLFNGDFDWIDCEVVFVVWNEDVVEGDVVVCLVVDDLYVLSVVCRDDLEVWKFW